MHAYLDVSKCHQSRLQRQQGKDVRPGTDTQQALVSGVLNCIIAVLYVGYDSKHLEEAPISPVRAIGVLDDPVGWIVLGVVTNEHHSMTIWQHSAVYPWLVHQLGIAPVSKKCRKICMHVQQAHK